MAEHQIAVRRAIEALDHLTDPDPPWHDILRTARDMVGADSKASDRLQSRDVAQYFRLLRRQLAQREKTLAIGWKTVDSAFSDVGEAVLLVSRDAMVDKMSALAIRYLDEGRGWNVRGGKLCHPDAKIQALFDAYCLAVARDGKARSLAAAAGWGELTWVDINAAPQALSLVGNRMLLVRMRRKSAFAQPDVDRLESVFAITHAEAAVLAGLATGHSVEEVATLRKSSVLTVRKQVASLLNKMECNRQSELVRLASLL
ncbi:LuxR family transcriptional regulator [Achromobacter aegrifaciens]